MRNIQCSLNSFDMYCYWHLCNVTSKSCHCKNAKNQKHKMAIWLETSFTLGYSVDYREVLDNPAVLCACVWFTFQCLWVSQGEIHRKCLAWDELKAIFKWQGPSYMWEQLWRHDSSLGSKSERQKGQSIHRHRKIALLCKTFHCTSCSSTPCDTEERKKRQGCLLYLGDLCWCFGQCQCSSEGIGREFNQIQ